MEKVAGVYEIEIAGYKYYGSSINVYARKQNHITKLRSGMHRNLRLQRCFNKYGEDAMAFKILVICDEEFVLDEEQKYLDENIGNDNCLNFCKSASAPMAGVKFSEDHKRKIAESLYRNKYIFTYSDGKIEEFNSLLLVSERFGVSKKVVSKWFQRKIFGKNKCVLKKMNVIKAEKNGIDEIVVLPYELKTEPWILAGATSKTQYYREKRNENKTRNWKIIS
jgi:group I intron endonuclease